MYYLELTFTPTSRSLILCHSKTNDECLEERHTEEVSHGCRSSSSWKTDATSRDQTGYSATENGHWRMTKHSNLEKRGGSEVNNQSTVLSENKRSIRRSFSIKVGLQTSSNLLFPLSSMFI